MLFFCVYHVINKFVIENRGSALAAASGGDTKIGRDAILELMEAVEASIPTPKREVDKPFLMPVEDTFSISGRGMSKYSHLPRFCLYILMYEYLEFYLYFLFNRYCGHWQNRARCYKDRRRY